MSDIIRTFPQKKEIKICNTRFDSSFSDKYHELKDDFTKWEAGINYETNRKIKIGGRLHKNLKEKFLFKEGFIGDLYKIGLEQYLNETEIIKKNIQIENEQIYKYNESVIEIMTVIKKLQDWNDFVIFNDIKYGLPKILDNIHNENNCKMTVLIFQQEYECNKCRNGWFNSCNGCGIYDVYKCPKCGVIEF